MDLPTDHALLQDLDHVNAEVCCTQRRLLSLLAEADRCGLWEDQGANDMAHFVAMRYGVSWWKARRWLDAASALEALPCIREAFERGELSIDKVVELCRFATPETEARLLRWAEGVSSGAIRRRGDLEARRERQEAERVERERYLRWWTFDEGRRVALEAELPAAEGAAVAGAIEHLATRIPVMPGEEEPSYAECRRADALVAICAGVEPRLRGEGTGSGPSRDGAAIVIHAPVDALLSDDRSCRIQVGARIQDGIAHARSVQRLVCASKLRLVVEDAHGNAVGFGRASRDPSEAMLRQLAYRDTECRFPGCGARRFTQAHHIRWWSRGGATELDNLVLLCTFHHKLVHEYGWSLARDPDDTVRWYRPDGTRYRAGPAPPCGTDGSSGWTDAPPVPTDAPPIPMDVPADRTKTPVAPGPLGDVSNDPCGVAVPV